MGRELPNDYAINAMTAEVKRRRRDPQRFGYRYSYGKLIADTTPVEREIIAENYRRRMLKAPTSEGRYREPDDQEDLEKASKVGGKPE